MCHAVCKLRCAMLSANCDVPCRLQTATCHIARIRVVTCTFTCGMLRPHVACLAAETVMKPAYCHICLTLASLVQLGLPSSVCLCCCLARACSLLLFLLSAMQPSWPCMPVCVVLYATMTRPCMPTWVDPVCQYE